MFRDSAGFVLMDMPMQLICSAYGDSSNVAVMPFKVSIHEQ